MNAVAQLPVRALSCPNCDGLAVLDPRSTAADPRGRCDYCGSRLVGAVLHPPYGLVRVWEGGPL